MWFIDFLMPFSDAISYLYFSAMILLSDFKLHEDMDLFACFIYSQNSDA